VAQACNPLGPSQEPARHIHTGSMSGELFSVYGKIQYSPLEQCPAELRGESVKLASKSGEVFEVEADAACMSKCVRAIVLANGPEEAIPFPLKSATVSRVVEYMKYHMTNPFGAMRTPLESDNLVECGATKWDSSFVSVDKDSVIELVLAAALFQIPSLFFLTGAKLAIMTKDKPADKLLKDFALALDMSQEEEEQVKQKVLEAQAKRWGSGYDDSLTAIACIVSALSVAAEKNGLTMPEAAAGGAAAGVRSYRLASWRAAVLQDWRLLAEAPAETRSDRELIAGVLPASAGAALAHASDELRSDRALVLEAVRHSGSLLSEAAPELRGDRAFVLEALRLSGAALGGASEELRGSRELVLAAAREGRGSALQGAADSLRADRELVLEATAEDPEAFKHASEELRGNRDFVLQVVRMSGRALQYVPLLFKADQEVVQAAVSSDDTAAAHAHASRRSEMGRSMPWDSGVWQKEEADKQEKAGVPGGSKIVPCPHRPDVSRDDALYTRKVRIQKLVLFSGMGTITPNIGQTNYLAANSLHDRMPGYSRPEVDTVTLLQGAVGGTVGMRWKAFASADQLANASPESMLQITDECMILSVLCTKMDPPEAVAGAFLDELSRQFLLAPSAGVIQGESAAVPWGPTAGGGSPPAKPTPPREPRREPRGAPRAGADASPLGGWPALAAPSERAGAQAPRAHGEELAEGTRVQLIGLSPGNKLNFRPGTVVKQFKDGKWKVRMDDKHGNVLVTRDKLQVLPHDPPAAEGKDGALPAASGIAVVSKPTKPGDIPAMPASGSDDEDDEPPPLENGESDVEPPPLESGESDDEPPPLEDREGGVEGAALLAGATAPFRAPFAAPLF